MPRSLKLLGGTSPLRHFFLLTYMLWTLNFDQSKKAPYISLNWIFILGLFVYKVQTSVEVMIPGWRCDLQRLEARTWIASLFVCVCIIYSLQTFRDLNGVDRGVISSPLPFFPPRTSPPPSSTSPWPAPSSSTSPWPAPSWFTVFDTTRLTDHSELVSTWFDNTATSAGFSSPAFGFSTLVFFFSRCGFAVVPLGFLVGGVKLDPLEWEASNDFGFRSVESLKSKRSAASFFGDLGTPGGSSIFTKKNFKCLSCKRFKCNYSFYVNMIKIQSFGTTSTSTWEHQRLWSGGWIGLRYVISLLDWSEMCHFVIGLVWNMSFCYWTGLKYVILLLDKSEIWYFVIGLLLS